MINLPLFKDSRFAGKRQVGGAEAFAVFDKLSNNSSSSFKQWDWKKFVSLPPYIPPVLIIRCIWGVWLQEQENIEQRGEMKI